MSFHIDQAARRIEELEDAITANDVYLQRLQDEGTAKDIQIEGLSNMLTVLRKSHAELLAALRRAQIWIDSDVGVGSFNLRNHIQEAITNAEKLK